MEETSLQDEYYDHVNEGVDYGHIKNTVFGILSDMTGRRGLKQGWSQIDYDIKEEIIQKWIDIVTLNLK